MRKQMALNFFMLLLSIDALAISGEEFRTLNLGLLDAAKKGEPELVASRLHEGASMHTRDRFGNTALIYAARAGDSDTARV